MSTISSINNTSGDGWAQFRAARAATQNRIQNDLLSKVDADGSGSIDSSELQSALNTIATKTGVTINTTATDLLAKADGNGDGSLDATELDKALQSVLPPPSTMDFAQSRSADSTSARGQAGDDLFSTVDADGSGSIDQSELTALMEAMAQDDTSSASSANDTQFAKLDTNGDGSLSQAEFDAGRPSGGPGGPGGPQGAGGMPPPPPPTSSSSSSSSSDNNSYDPLDTNHDGVVSASELAAASGTTSTDPLAALFDAVDTDGDQQLSASETDALAKQVATVLETLQQASSDTGTNGNNGNGNQDQPLDLRTLAQLVLKQYEDIAKNQSSTTTSTLSATA